MVFLDSVLVIHYSITLIIIPLNHLSLSHPLIDYLIG
jgi:hypothetical protein